MITVSYLSCNIANKAVRDRDHFLPWTAMFSFKMVKKLRLGPAALSEHQ